MVRAVTPDDLVRRAPVTEAPSDPLRGVNDAISRLVSVIETQQRQPALPVMSPPSEPRPAYLEATVERDKAGRMTSITIVPYY